MRLQKKVRDYISGVMESNSYLKATGKEIFPNNEIKIDVFRKLCVLECVNLTHLVKYWSH